MTFVSERAGPATIRFSLKHQSDSLLSTLLEELPEAVFLLRKAQMAAGEQLVFVAANALALEKTELANRFISGTPLRDYFPQWVERGIDDMLFDALRKRKSLSFEDIQYNSSVLSVESAVMYKIKPMNEDYLVLVMQDLTELKEIEHELQKSNTELSRTLAELETTGKRLAESDDIVRTMQLGLLVLQPDTPANETDKSFRILSANAAAQKRVLRTKTFVEGDWMNQHFPTFGKRGLLELLLEVIATGKPVTFEDVQYQSSQLSVATAYSYKAFPLPEGRCGLIIEDITERKKAEEQTLKVSSELQKALESLKTTQKQLVLSEKMAALGQLIAGLAHEINTPISAAQVSGRNLVRLIPEVLTLWPELEEEVPEEVLPTIRGFVEHILKWKGNLTTSEARMLRKQLESELELRGVADAARLARILVEVHLEERVEEILPLLQLQSSEKLLRVASRLGHIKDNLDSIEVATDKAAGVVKALKNYSYVQQDDHQVKGNLHENLDNVLLLYQNHIKEGVVIVRDYGEIPPIPFFADQLPQVWANLISNALYAMDYRGTLTLKTRLEGPIVSVEVTDTGSGIPEEVQERIFEPFFTTKPQGQGTGLGLDVVRRILERHKGSIDLHSRPGRTTFTVRMPIYFKS